MLFTSHKLGLIFDLQGQSSELHRDSRDIAKEPSGNLSGQTPNAPLSFSRTADAHTSNNASLSR